MNQRRLLFFLVLLSSSFLYSQPTENLLVEALINGEWGKINSITDDPSILNEKEAVKVWLKGYANLATLNFNESTDYFSLLSRDKDLLEIEFWVTRLVKEYPENPVLLMLKGDVYARLGNLEQSNPYLSKAVSFSEKSKDFLLFNILGVVDFLSGKNNAAKQNFKKALKINPNFTDALVNQGIVEFSIGNNAKSISLFSKAIMTNPRFAIAYNARGLVFIMKKEWDQAEEDFKIAINLTPNFRTAQNNLESMLILKKQSSQSDQESQLNVDERGTTISTDVGDLKTDGRFLKIKGPLIELVSWTGGQSSIGKPLDRGGVKMTVKLVNKQEADFSEIWGQSKETANNEESQRELFAPFLIFSAKQPDTKN